MYHLRILALVNQVLRISVPKPKPKIKKIWRNESGRPVTKTNAGIIANNPVMVMKMPVLNAPKILSLTLPSLFFKTRLVKRISVSTEYPINIRNAAMPAAESFMPRRFTSAKGIAILAKTAKTTAKLGIVVRNITNTTRDINTNEKIIAMTSCR